MILYRNDGLKRYVKSTREETDVSGWALYIGETKDGWYSGQGKSFMMDGRVFYGELDKNMMIKGKMSYL